MINQVPATSIRNGAIDSLRGYAAITVLIFHAREIVWVGISGWLKSGGVKWNNVDVILGFLSIPFRFGWWGVPLFFVISGYCIHRPEVRRRGSNAKMKLDLSGYTARRAWRIYPVLIGALLLTLVLDRLTPKSAAAASDISLACFIANLVALQNIVAPSYGGNVPLWTLAIEIHFYVVYPIFFYLLGRIGVIKTMLIVFGVSAFSWCSLECYSSRIEVFLPYWFSWCVGAYIAEAEAGFARFPGRVLALLSIPCVFLGLTYDYWKDYFVHALPLVYTILAVPLALVIWNAIRFPTNVIWNNPISRAASKVGVFSYSLYVTHVPVLKTYHALVQNGESSTNFNAVIVASIVAIGIGYFFFLLVERWTLTLPWKPTRPDAILSPLGPR